VFIAGTHFGIPPFRWVYQLNESIKDSAIDKYGKPPYGHAELSSLETLVFRMGLDLKNTIHGLKKYGIKFQSEKETIKEIAEKNKATPQEIYEIINKVQGKVLNN
jgi:hypothetical protein